MDLIMSEVVGAIYDCVTNEDLWPTALRLIGEQVNGYLTTIAVFDTTTNQARLAQVACEDEEAVRALLKHARDVPFYHVLHRMEIDEPGTLERMFALYGPDGEDVWKNGALYQNFHQKFGVANSIDMAVLKRPTRIGTINISVRYSDIGKTQFDVMAMIGPHIRRAVTIHDMLQMERAEAGIFRDVIDRIEHGVVIVADTLEVLYANPAAETFLREQSLLATTHGRLTMRFPQAHAATVRAVSLGVRDEVELAGTGIDIPLGATSRPAVAHVLPLQRRALGRQIESRAAAAIFIAAAGTVIQTSVDAIAALFGLTAAERRVAAYVADGMTRNEIAEAQGVSAGTVKSQLAAIYDKTGTGDQRHLQGLMRELSPPVRRG